MVPFTLLSFESFLACDPSYNEMPNIGKISVEPKMRIELTTYALRVRCSTPELPGRVCNLFSLLA
jgi:hypothetical protein